MVVTSKIFPLLWASRHRVVRLWVPRTFHLGIIQGSSIQLHQELNNEKQNLVVRVRDYTTQLYMDIRKPLYGKQEGVFRSSIGHGRIFSLQIGS